MNRKVAVLVAVSLAGCGAEPIEKWPISTSLAALGTDSTQYNFEAGTQGWTRGGRQIASLAASTAQVFLGNQSLAVGFKTNPSPSTQGISVATTAQPAGATIAFHLFVPVGMKLNSVRVYAQENAASGGRITSSTQPVANLIFGAWNTVSVPVPANAAPLQAIGIEYSMTGKWTGTAYVDSIGWTAVPVADAGSAIDAGTPTVDAGTPPVIDAGTPVIDAGTPPVVDAGTLSGVAQCLRIMPMGDSITLGVNGGYRNGLWDRLRAAGCGVNFVGTQPDEWALLPDHDHEGHPGWTSWDLSQYAASFVTTHTPDYVLLMIGTNDVAWWSVQTADEVAATHALNIDAIRAARPNAWIIVSSIPTMSEYSLPPLYRSRVQFGIEFNNAIHTRVNARIAAGQKLIWMDGYSLLTLSDLYDGIHPTFEAHYKLADGWFNALQPIINCNGTAPVCPY